MNERSSRRPLGNPLLSAAAVDDDAVPAPVPAYQSPFGSDATGHHPGCTAQDDDGTWLGHAERAATALRSTVAGLRTLTAGGDIDPDGAPATALRAEAVRLARIVTTCLDGYSDPTTRNNPPHEGMHL